MASRVPHPLLSAMSLAGTANPPADAVEVVGVRLAPLSRRNRHLFFPICPMRQEPAPSALDVNSLKA